MAEIDIIAWKRRFECDLLQVGKLFKFRSPLNPVDKLDWLKFQTFDDRFVQGIRHSLLKPKLANFYLGHFSVVEN